VAGLTPVSMLRRMVEIPSPTGREGELARYVLAQMRELGFRARIDPAGNVIGETGPPGEPAIMLLGHLDTVPGDLPVREDDGALYGRGTVDAKGPLAAMIWAAAGSAKRLVVVGAAGEEGLSPGAWYLVRGARPAAVIIGEPSGVGTVVVGFKGIVRFTLRVTCEPAHTSSPGPKAVEVAARFWQDLGQHLGQAYPGGRHFDRAIPALVRMSGDTVRAEADITCRIPPGFDFTAFRNWLAGRAGDGLLTFTEELPAVRSPRTDPVVQALSDAVRAHAGPPAVKVKLGTSDMNIVGPAWGVPIAAYGPGDARLDHSGNERIVIAEYLTAIAVLRDAISAIAGTRCLLPSADVPGGGGP
jgi:[amino group carrier protein]-lysine/ornithine hydrolase